MKHAKRLLALLLAALLAFGLLGAAFAEGAEAQESYEEMYISEDIIDAIEDTDEIEQERSMSTWEKIWLAITTLIGILILYIASMVTWVGYWLTSPILIPFGLAVPFVGLIMPFVMAVLPVLVPVLIWFFFIKGNLREIFS